jgi:immune inhibitor A
MRSAIRFSILSLCFIALLHPVQATNGLFSSDLTYGVACHAQFEWEVDGLVVHFINQSTSDGEITSYQWNFGDGHIGDGQNPNHTYEEPGEYLVCLIIHDNQGCVSDVCHEVVIEEVQGECNAQFEFTIEGLEVHFINQSTSDGEIVSYHWKLSEEHLGD